MNPTLTHEMPPMDVIDPAAEAARAAEHFEQQQVIPQPEAVTPQAMDLGEVAMKVVQVAPGASAPGNFNTGTAYIGGKLHTTGKTLYEGNVAGASAWYNSLAGQQHQTNVHAQETTARLRRESETDEDAA